LCYISIINILLSVRSIHSQLIIPYTIIFIVIFVYMFVVVGWWWCSV